MALYLGNQKVSLRSGQDPTFDYGFDSNGRLVFANKNATEINNFLNYDSSYSEVLDLSNLSKMEKVAVNGTADRKMEGLKGLLVSPNAPFTGSSPQINASYTGLSKSALVSLFESMPYNVGYEVVGSPTIENGVVSGFSVNDYLTLPQPDLSGPFEMFFKFTTPSTWGTAYDVVFSTSGVSFQKQGPNRYLAYYLIGTGESSFTQYNGSHRLLQENTTYYVKIVYDETAITAYISTDGNTWETDMTANYASGFTSSICVFGRNRKLAQQFWNGSIDLNETYIKVNGVPWFTGKPAMTKTCSIVGCTGTADLTQEDKNIILNKGWSLTVQ